MSPKLKLDYMQQEGDSLSGRLPSSECPQGGQAYDPRKACGQLCPRLMCTESKLFLNDLLYRRKHLNVPE